MAELTTTTNDFLEHLKTFVPDLLAPNELIVKEIGGRYVSGRELLEYFKVYINVFAGEYMLLFINSI